MITFEKIYKVMKFNQKGWLKSYIWYQYRTKKQKENNSFEKDFFKLMNNSVFGKTMESTIKYQDIKLVTTKRRRNYLVSKPNYYTTQLFTKNLIATEMKKTQIFMSKSVYLGLSMLELRKL